ALFDPELAKRPQVVVLNKLDLPDVKDALKKLTTAFARRKVRLHAISAATGAGVEALLEEVWKVLAAERHKLSTGSEGLEIDREGDHEHSSPQSDRPSRMTPRTRSTRSASKGKTQSAGRPRHR